MDAYYYSIFLGLMYRVFTVNEKTKVVGVERILYARRDWLRIL